MKAKSTTTLKALATSEAKAESSSKADSQAEVEDYFSLPFQQVLAQSTSFEDATQESAESFDKMPTEGIDLGGLKGKIEEAAKPVTENIDEQDKKAM